ncbi:IclR family transcriptional regulator [Geodermatophilus sp. SYSU D00703]
MVRTLKSVDQALALMEYLASTAAPQTVTGLSREFGLSKATVHRMLGTLRARGYVVQDPVTARYSFGLTAAQLSTHPGAAETLTSACMPAMRWLWRKTGETVLLAVRDGDKAVVVEKLDSTLPVLSTYPLGRLMPLHAVSSGLALLAHLPHDEVQAILTASCLVQHTPRSRVTSEAVWAEIRSIRQKGYAINREGFRDGVSGVAAPVHEVHPGPATAAMAVCVPSSRFEPQVDDLCASVVDAAAWASESLRNARRTVLATVPDSGAAEQECALRYENPAGRSGGRTPKATVPSSVGADG